MTQAINNTGIYRTRDNRLVYIGGIGFNPVTREANAAGQIVVVGSNSAVVVEPHVFTWHQSGAFSGSPDDPFDIVAGPL